uniref:Uncharacterized protein n=1 Tax=Oryza meridionalis TaxID=40149 RepID=A0A0E0DNN3_9ORYZ
CKENLIWPSRIPSKLWTASLLAEISWHSTVPRRYAVQSSRWHLGYAQRSSDIGDNPRGTLSHLLVRNIPLKHLDEILDRVSRGQQLKPYRALLVDGQDVEHP